jgi:membrane protease YdiL (CAAX protease family)
MFKPAVLRIAAVIAMVLSVFGLLISLFIAKQSGSGLFALGAVSWLFLLAASYFGFRLAAYKLYEDEYKKVGLRIYLIIGSFGLFLFVGVAIGFVLSVALLGTLWGLKRNYDEWVPSSEESDNENPS